MLDARISNQDGNPDVFWADQPRIAALASRGYTADITEQFAEYRDAWDEAAYESSTFDYKRWGVPIANSTQLLYFKK